MPTKKYQKHFINAKNSCYEAERELEKLIKEIKTNKPMGIYDPALRDAEIIALAGKNMLMRLEHALQDADFALRSPDEKTPKLVNAALSELQKWLARISKNMS